MSLSLQSGDLQARLKTDGTVFDLNEKTEGYKDMVMVTSSSRPFQLLFLLASHVFRNRLYKNHLHLGYRLHALVSTAAVEQFLIDPCRYSQLNTKLTKTIVAGVGSREAIADAFRPLQGSQKVPLGKFWIRALENTTVQTLGVNLSRTANAKRQRLWFHELTVLKRSFCLYYLDGGSHLSVLKPVCTTSTPPSDDDRIDNDCDGFIDEELINGRDDDGDDRSDEDESAFELRNCLINRRMYFWEPNRYRITRFESQLYEFAHRLPYRSTTLVVLSAGVGVVMVFIFIFCIWVMDAIENKRHPGAFLKIF